MGYKRTPKTFRLVFDDPEFEGFEISMRSLSVDEFIEFTTLFEQFSTITESTTEEAITDVVKLIDMFSQAIVQWNLEDENDVAIPATVENVRKQEFAFVSRIVTAWIRSMSSVPLPLPEESSNGDSSQEQSLQLDSASESLPNSLVPS